MGVWAAQVLQSEVAEDGGMASKEMWACLGEGDGGM